MDLALLGALTALWLVPDADVAIVVLFPLLILQICTDTSPLARALGARVPYALGQWSYAIYLIHWPVAQWTPALSRWLSWPVACVITLAAVIALAALAFRFVERPSRRAIRGWLGRRRTSIAAEPSAP